MKALQEQVAEIVTRDDLVVFIERLRSDLESNSAQWENPTLGAFLAALGSWIEDMHGYYLNHGREPPTTPSWRTVAEMLAAARVYE